MRNVTRPVVANLALAALAALTACQGALDPNGPAWTQVSTGDVPPRWGHTAVYDGKRDRMVVFGGDSDQGQKNDLWALDLATLTWSQLAAANPPGPRTDLAGVMDTLNDRLIIVGGRVGFVNSIDEVWAYSFADATWRQLPSGPSARHDVPGTSDGTHAFIFGGAGAFLQSLDDLWQLDLATDTWTVLPGGDVRPAARTSGALEYLAGSIYVSGGHDADKVQRDSWRYDLTAQRWIQLDVDGTYIAAAHFGHALDASCPALYVSGGDNLDNYDVAYTDVLSLGPSPKIELVGTANLPPPRDHPSMILDATRRRLVLYGGGTLGDGLGLLDDCWVLPLGACP
jgi:hypothetical protein